MAARKRVMDELTREMIITEANRQFLTKDYHQVSMRAIAKELGCTHGALYYHFTNKAELFYAVVEQYFEQINDLLEKACHMDGDARIKTMAVFTGFMEFGLNNQSQYQYMFMLRNAEVDTLSQSAANESYAQFAQSLQHIHSNQLSIAKIYATFISLHGFVSFYHGGVSNYKEVEATAVMHAQFLIDALE